MENTTLYRKYRPQNFSELYGQEYIIRAIKNSLDNNKMAHAYLFYGPRGVGKTTIARLIAKGLNCETNITSNPCDNCNNCNEITKGISMDVIEIDAASNRGIDEIRNLKENAGYLPVKSRKKIYIIDEVHMLTKEAFNALLKILEEPPKHILFILATTEIEKIPDTVISRCQRYDFKVLSENQVIEMLKNVAQKENIVIDEESLELVFQKSEGSARDAFSIFEQLISNYYGENKINLKMTEKALGFVSKLVYEKFLNLLENENKKEIIDFIDNLWFEGIQIDLFLKQFCKFIKKVDKLDIDFKIKVISNILDLLVKFKNEDDKKLLAYLIINKILKKEKIVKTIDESTSNYKRKFLDFKLKNWNEFLKYLKDEGRLKYYHLLSNVEVSINENDLILNLENQANFTFYFNSSTIDFIEKEILNLYGTHINVKLKDINIDTEEDSNIKLKIMDLLNAVEE